MWNEVKDRLQSPGTGLSGGQQQRLCIARAIAVSPATAKIEELIHQLGKNYSIVIVTHSMQQAARVSQRTAYFHLGELIEVGLTKQIFTTPQDKQTDLHLTMI